MVFPTFFNLSLNLIKRNSWSEPQSAPGLAFYIMIKGPIHQEDTNSVYTKKKSPNIKSSLGISNFLEEISSLPHSIVLLYFFALSLSKAFLSLLAVLWNSAFNWVYLSFSPFLFTSLLFTAIFKAFSDSYFAFLHFFFLGMVLILVSCIMSWTSVHSSSGTLSIRSSPLNLFLTSTV